MTPELQPSPDQDESDQQLYRDLIKRHGRKEAMRIMLTKLAIRRDAEKATKRTKREGKK